MSSLADVFRVLNRMRDEWCVTSQSSDTDMGLGPAIVDESPPTHPNIQS